MDSQLKSLMCAARSARQAGRRLVPTIKAKGLFSSVHAVEVAYELPTLLVE